MVLPPKLVKAKHFHQWNKTLEIALSTVDLDKALTDPKHKQSKVVLMVILGIIDFDLISSFVDDCPTAAQLISKMKARYSATAAGAADLNFAQLAGITMQKGETLNEFHTRFMGIVSLLAAADQKPTDLQQLSFFLNALPPEYKPVIDIISFSSESKTVEDVFIHLLKKENSLLKDSMSPNGMALYTSGYSGYSGYYGSSYSPYSSSNSPGGSYRNQQQQYSNQQQQRPNHHQQQQRPYHHHEQQQQQFESPDSNGSNRGSNRGFSGTCNYCKERGHMKRDCPKLAAKNQNNDMKKQLDDIQSRLHALLAALPPSDMSPLFAPAY